MPAPYSVFHRLVVSVSCSHMQCPVGALRTPRLPRAPAPEPQHTCSATIIFSHRQQSTTPIEGQALNQPSGSGIGPERALEAIKPLSSRNSAKASSYPELPCERRTDPAEPPARHRPLAPAPALCHRKTGVPTFPASAAPTRGAPTAHAAPGASPTTHFHQTTLFRDRLPPRDRLHISPAAAGRRVASIGTSTPCLPSRDSAKAPPVPTFPASAAPTRGAPTAHAAPGASPHNPPRSKRSQ